MQSDPHAMPLGVDVTPPAPVRATVSVRDTVVTAKFAVVLAVPEGVVTKIFALTAPTGTVNVIVASSTTVNVAATDPTVTAVAVPSPLPLTVTLVAPGNAAFGENPEIFGSTANDPEGVAVPAGVETAIVPLAAPRGTIARIVVEFTRVTEGEAMPSNVTELTP